MKKMHIVFLLLSSLCVPSFAYEIEEGNHTELRDGAIQELVNHSISAMKAQDKKSLLKLFHSSCTSLSSEQKKDLALFIKYLLRHSLEADFQWKATAFQAYDGTIFKINRFPVHPEINIDLFKKYPGKRNGKKYWSLSLWATREDGKLKLIYYMNDYMAKKINKPAEHPTRSR